MWHVSSRSGVATLQTAIHLLLTYLLTYRVGADRMADGTQELETIVDTGVEPRQTLP